jgi:hypothetical protein
VSPPSTSSRVTTWCLGGNPGKLGRWSAGNVAHEAPRSWIVPTGPHEPERKIDSWGRRRTSRNIEKPGDVARAFLLKRLRLGPPSLGAHPKESLRRPERKLPQGLPAWGGRPSPSAAPNRAT